jgi:hypothetical protein
VQLTGSRRRTTSRSTRTTASAACCATAASGLHVGVPGHPAYWPPGDFVFRTGASLTIEPNPCTHDMTFGATAGAMVIVHEAACEQIHKAIHRSIIAV